MQDHRATIGNGRVERATRRAKMDRTPARSHAHNATRYRPTDRMIVRGNASAARHHGATACAVAVSRRKRAER